MGGLFQRGGGGGKDKGGKSGGGGGGSADKEKRSSEKRTSGRPDADADIGQFTLGSSMRNMGNIRESLGQRMLNSVAASAIQSSDRLSTYRGFRAMNPSVGQGGGGAGGPSAHKGAGGRRLSHASILTGTLRGDKNKKRRPSNSGGTASQMLTPASPSGGGNMGVIKILSEGET
eukprot:g13257.t1